MRLPAGPVEVESVDLEKLMNRWGYTWLFEKVGSSQSGWYAPKANGVLVPENNQGPRLDG